MHGCSIIQPYNNLNNVGFRTIKVIFMYVCGVYNSGIRIQTGIQIVLTVVENTNIILRSISIVYS